MRRLGLGGRWVFESVDASPRFDAPPARDVVPASDVAQASDVILARDSADLVLAAETGRHDGSTVDGVAKPTDGSTALDGADVGFVHPPSRCSRSEES
jgi:hypothetical protein